MLETITKLGKTKSTNLKKMMKNLAQELTPKHLDKIVVRSSVLGLEEDEWIQIAERKKGIRGFFHQTKFIFLVH